MSTIPTKVEISSLEDLESSIRDIGPGVPVFAVFIGASSLFEAAAIHSRLNIQVVASDGLWKIDRASLAGLRRATEHYKELDLLEISVDLMELDLKDGVPMKVVRFTGVRATANDVITTAHPSTIFAILDDITIEAQWIARVAKALGFGGEEVEVPDLTEDDFMWLTADGAAVMLADGAGGHHVEQQDAALGLENLQIGSRGTIDEKLESSDGGSHVKPRDVLLGRSEGAHHGEIGRSEGGHHVELGLVNLGVKDPTLDGQLCVVGGPKCDQNFSIKDPTLDGQLGVTASNDDQLESDGGVGGYKDDQLGCNDGTGVNKVDVSWVEMKEETVLAILRFKISKLRAAISSAKSRAFISS